jgi:hypothetical protein
MGLCGPQRCGCAFVSSSFTMNGSGQLGDPLQIETYDGVATQVPDTRPGSGVRFEGMRVYCTDTDRTFIWNGSVWRCISQPMRAVGLSNSLTVGSTGSEAAGYSRFGHQVMVQYEAGLGEDFFVAGPLFTPPVAAKWVGARQMGIAEYYDVSTGNIYHGSCDLYYADGQIRLYAPAPTTFTLNATTPFTWDIGDQLWFKLIYDAADNV